MYFYSTSQLSYVLCECKNFESKQVQKYSLREYSCNVKEKEIKKKLQINQYCLCLETLQTSVRVSCATRGVENLGALYCIAYSQDSCFSMVNECRKI